MFISILKHNLRNISLVCLFGLIMAGLVGCSSPVAEPVVNKAATPEANRSFKPPEVISLLVDKSSFSADGLDLNVQAKIMNHNPFTVNVENPGIKIQGITGFNYCSSTAPGNQIGAVAVQTFDFSATLPEEAFKEQDLTARIDFDSEYDGKTLPVSDTAALGLRDIIKKLYITPMVMLQAQPAKISWNGQAPQVETLVKGTIINNNPIGIVGNAVRITANDKQGAPMGAGSIEGNFTVAPNSDYTFEKTIILPLQSLNEPTVIVTAEISASTVFSMDSLAGKAVMGAYKLADLVQVPQMVLSPKTTWTDHQPGLEQDFTINTSLTNNNLYGLTAGTLTINVYKPVNTLVGTATQTGFTSGIPALGTKTMTNLVTINPHSVADISGEAVITASIPISIESLKVAFPVTSSLEFTVSP